MCPGQERLYMVIMSFIHKTVKFELKALLFGEIKCYFTRGGEKGLEHREPLRGLQGLALIMRPEPRQTSPRLVSNLPAGEETRVLQR